MLFGQYVFREYCGVVRIWFVLSGFVLVMARGGVPENVRPAILQLLLKVLGGLRPQVHS